jgi:hypothetical protein
MIKTILEIVSKALGLWTRIHDKRNKPEALRERAQGEIDKAVDGLDADSVNAMLDADLKRLQDRRRDTR